MDPDHLAALKRRGWIGFGLILGSLLPFLGVEQSLLSKLI